LEGEAIIDGFAGIRVKVSGAGTGDGQGNNAKTFRDEEERRIEAD